MHLWPRGWSVDSYIIKMIFFLMNIDQHMDSLFFNNGLHFEVSVSKVWRRSFSGDLRFLFKENARHFPMCFEMYLFILVPLVRSYFLAFFHVPF